MDLTVRIFTWDKRKPDGLLSRLCDWMAQGAVVGMRLMAGGNILLRLVGKSVLGPMTGLA